jgi:uncharacterized membrane protein YhaH (DUF805 family)
MNLETFTSFQGRIRRKTFWLCLLAMMIIQWILLFGLAMAFNVPMTPAADGGVGGSFDVSGPAAIPFVIVFLVFLWPILAIYTKRWHDRNKSGWWTLIALIPFVGAIWLLVELGFLSGTEGPNDFGSDPKA